ncbi:hypothetical protein CAOG_06864 [Capsaspora owczarzaki ATCC 30864]|uniref:hypothetical protein n=1 Tax=Capsaspora owczarzaki (strain ATCC 30864) TaxID=595528 RepID=UPI0003523541|nr:hypothetical protein CAOG_06864 [Capsaspora owczarzaki ATCC 30864]|eukprot:XP_004344485.2 hypothetical protein CAOG_06864 [Capsaspora owczarzaki ATCC 30864]
MTQYDDANKGQPDPAAVHDSDDYEDVGAPRDAGAGAVSTQPLAARPGSTATYATPYAVQGDNVSSTYTSPQPAPGQPPVTTSIDMPASSHRKATGGAHGSAGSFGCGAFMVSLAMFDALPDVKHKIFLALHMCFFTWALFTGFSWTYQFANMLLIAMGIFHVCIEPKNRQLFSILLAYLLFSIVTDICVLGVFGEAYSNGLARDKFSLAMAAINIAVKPFTLAFGIKEYRDYFVHGNK